MTTKREHFRKLDPTVFLTEAELARRWRHSVRSLQRWRAGGTGLSHLRIGRRIVYRLADVEAFEAGAAESGGQP